MTKVQVPFILEHHRECSGHIDSENIAPQLVQYVNMVTLLSGDSGSG